MGIKACVSTEKIHSVKLLLNWHEASVFFVDIQNHNHIEPRNKDILLVLYLAPLIPPGKGLSNKETWKFHEDWKDDYNFLSYFLMVNRSSVVSCWLQTFPLFCDSDTCLWLHDAGEMPKDKVYVQFGSCRIKWEQIMEDLFTYWGFRHCTIFLKSWIYTLCFLENG